MIRVSLDSDPLVVEPFNADGTIGIDDNGNLVVITKERGTTTTHFKGPDLRKTWCPICGKGWGLTAEEWLDHTGTNLYPDRDVHLSCLMRYWKVHDRALLMSCLPSKHHFKLKELPNGYTTHPVRRLRSWQGVVYPAKNALMIFGYRRHVYSIEVSLGLLGHTFCVERLQEMFAEEDVTKKFTESHFLVHAWGDHKAVEYLTKIFHGITEGDLIVDPD
jgi:hypothetical protein